VRWDDRPAGRLEGLLSPMFEDLEQQAEGLALDARDAEVAELGPAEYAQVPLDARLFAAVGGRLQLTVAGPGTLEGRLRRVGDGWCLLDAGVQEWLVRLPAVLSLRGLVHRAVAAEARPLTGRLGLGSALRGLAEARVEVALHRTDGSVLRGRPGRVGADFVELRVGEPPVVEVVPFTALAAVSGG
jgi:hypothetical protein